MHMSMPRRRYRRRRYTRRRRRSWGVGRLEGRSTYRTGHFHPRFRGGFYEG